MGNLECIGGGGGGAEKTAGSGGEGAGGDGGGDGAGDGDGDGAAGGEEHSAVIFREPIPSPSRGVSGSASSLAASCEEVEWQTAPRFLARTAALWHARDAVSAALVLFKASTGTSTGAYGLARRKKCALISERAFLPKIWDLQCPIYIVLAIEGKNT